MGRRKGRHTQDDLRPACDIQYGHVVFIADSNFEGRIFEVQRTLPLLANCIVKPLVPSSVAEKLRRHQNSSASGILESALLLLSEYIPLLCNVPPIAWDNSVIGKKSR